MTHQPFSKDKYGRTIADGTNDHPLVRDGWCWWYRKYAPGDASPENVDADARETKRGLWANLHPVLLWEWRKRKELVSW